MSDFWGDLATAEPAAPPPAPDTPRTHVPDDLTRCGLLDNDHESLTPAQARAMAISVRALDVGAYCARLADVSREALNRNPKDKYLAASVVWCEQMADEFRALSAKQRERLE